MYYLVINGAQIGPFPAEKIRAMVVAGEITTETPCWTEGMADWLSVGRVIPPTPAASLVPPPVAAPPVTASPTKKRSCLWIGLSMAGILFLVGILGLGIGFYFLNKWGNGLDASSKAYADEAIPAIVTSWSQDELAKRESDEFRKATPDDELTKLFDTFRRLGPLKSYKGCKGEAVIGDKIGEGVGITAHYEARATFENGEAEIRIFLIRQPDGSWLIRGFRVNSPVLVN